MGSPQRANAGAGTGKTYAIEMRVQHLIENAIPPRQILLMTFTRKAAEEMKARIRRRIGSKAEDITIGNFHSIAAQQLRELRQKSDTYLSIIDQNDSEEFWDQAYREIVSEPPTKFIENVHEFRKLQGKKEEIKTKIDPKKEWNSLLNRINGYLRDLRSQQINKNNNEDFAEYALPRLIQENPEAQTLQSIWDLTNYIKEGLAGYERIKAETNSIDYDDALLKWANALKTNAAYRERIHNTWPHVLVDEYQDTNFLQEEIIQNLNKTNLTVVGDPAQCIYAFRTAVPELMLSFHTRYPNTKETQLHQNYRSKNEVLHIANQILEKHNELIDHNETTMAKLQLTGTRGDGGSAEIIRFEKPEDESEFIANKILELLKNGVPKKEIVVLARTSYYNFPILETKLKTNNIPVQIWGGSSLMESLTMKDITAFLKIIQRPNQHTNFMRIAKYATIGQKMGERAHEEMFLRWKMGLPPLPQTETFLKELDLCIELAKHEKTRPDLSTCAIITTKAVSYIRKLYEQADKINTKRKSEFELIKKTIAELFPKIKKEKEIANIQEGVKLEDLITQLSLNPIVDSDDGQSVTLSTIHQAKGLEWEHVFITGASEGPLMFFRNEDATTEQEAEEECRLLYVAATRAKNHLTITYPGKAVRFLY